MSVQIHSREIFTDVVRATKRTDEGWLVGEVNATAAGVFAYPGRGPGGSTMLLLRHPADIFKPESIKTAYLKPVIIWHPAPEISDDGLLDVENIGELQIGTIGERHEIDDPNLVLSFAITRKDGIEAVESGLNAVSMGRDAKVVEETGTYLGKPYTHREIDCVYNHMALVDRGRMGPQAKIYLDRIEPEPKGNRMKKILLDGIEYEGAPEIINALEKAQKTITTQAAEHKTLLDAAVAEKEAEAGKVAAKDVEILALKDKLEKLPATIKAAAGARQKLMDRAKKMGVKEEAMTDDKSDIDMMKSAILESAPDTDFTGKSEDFIRGMFEAISADDENAEALNDGKKVPDEKKLNDRGEDEYIDPIRAAELRAEKDVNAWKPKA